MIKIQVMQNNLLELLHSGLDLLNISIDGISISQLIQYIDLLNIWNRKINLVSIKNLSDLIILHILDSLTIFKVIDIHSELKILDIGTGAGFPGMILKIASPPKNLTLVEKNPKKILFLKEVIRDLGLTGIVAINRDYTTLTGPDYSHGFDLAVSRAFSSKVAFFRNLSKFVKSDGALLIMAGPSLDSDSLKLEGFSRSACWEGFLPLSNQRRKIIKYSKSSSFGQ